MSIGVQYSAGTEARVVVDVWRNWSTSKCAPHFVPTNRGTKLQSALTFIESWDRCFV